MIANEVILSHILQGMCSLIHAGFKVNPYWMFGTVHKEDLKPIL